ncbi:hypothetical protein BH10BDE1_BH10BDE1_14630 [soil metagenome]
MNLNVLFRSSAIIGLLLGASRASAVEIDPPKLYGAVDVVTDFGIENPPADSGRLRIRSFEFGASSLIDAMWSAKVNIGGHDNSGTLDLEIQEAFVSSEQLIPNTEIKAGRFYLGLGVLNRMHSYDWGFTSPPKSQFTFFAAEPVADSGLEFTHRFGGAVPIELTAGLTNGWSYQHVSTPGRRPQVATHYLHPTAIFSFGDGRTLSTGLNYLGRTDADSVLTRLVGLDLTYKSLRGLFVQTIVQSEVYHRIQSSSTLPLAEDVGGYVWCQTSVGDGRWSVGGRLDAFTTLSLRNVSGDKRQNLDYGMTPTLSFQSSPASTLRASYSYLVESRDGDNTRAEQRVEIQLVALIGDPPARQRLEGPSTE